MLSFNELQRYKFLGIICNLFSFIVFIFASMKENRRVLLGMSGGTDSSVAALLLQDAGYEVTGVTFRFYEKDNSTEYLDDARDLCSRLGIPHLISDQREAFRSTIIDYFIREYMAGHTPVPCTLCNNYLKWPLLRQLADERGIYHLATGHYVRKRMIEGYWHITTGADADKDQSFFLWGLPQDIMERMLLPMGDLTKTRVREIAEERGFLKAATKKDSIGVCFCPMDYRSFLRKEMPAVVINKGKFFDEKGNFIAWHEGYPFYTIGQRRGLGIDLNRAVFVKEIIPSENKVVLGDLKSLEKMEMRLKDWNIINPSLLLGHDDVIVKIRYRKQANRCTVTLLPDNTLHVQLHEPLTAIASGQAAAFYRDDVILGGGIII
jgi:tRNA-specific 2-thiouridylase